MLLYKLIKYLFLLVICSFILACGGGGSSSGSAATGTSSVAATAYTGISDPALLNTTNTMKFVQLITSNEDVNDNLNYRYQNNETNKNISYLKLDKQLKKIALTAIHSQKFANREVSQSEACSQGGNYTLSGDTDSPDRVNIVFDQCKEDEVIRNGNALLVGTEHAGTMTFYGLSLLSGDIEVLYTGTYQYEEGGISTQTEDGGTLTNFTHSLSTSNLHALNKSTGEQVYMKDFFLRRYYGTSSNLNETERDLMSGQIYLSDEGYVQVTSSEDFFVGSASYQVDRGSFSLVGASNSKARVRSVYDYSYNSHELNQNKYRVDLDENGDGLFELSSLQLNSNSSADANEFESYANRPPIAVISDAEFLEQDDSLGENSILYLDAFRSNDLDQDAITFKWVVEEKPVGSVSQIDSPESVSTQYLLDVLGEYKISLKVTDSFGKTDIAFLNINTGNKPPKMTFNVSGYAYDLQTGESLNVVPLGGEVSVSVYIEDDFEDFTLYPNHNFNTAWLFSIPVGSQLNLANNIRSSYPTESSVSFTPDKEGVYRFTVSATDPHGLQSSEELSFTVKNFPPVAVIEDHGGANHAKVGDQFILFSQSYKHGLSGVYTDELVHEWAIESVPTGSTAQLVVDDFNNSTVYFTPDAIGDYSVSLKVTDDSGLSDTAYINFTVPQ